MRCALLSIAGLLAACAPEDPHHCGSPPVDCLGGTCSNGECTAWRLTTSVDFPTAIAADGNEVDWATQSGDLFAVPKAGGTGELVAHVTSYATSIATSARAYYVGSPMEGLFRVDRSSHEQFVLDTGNVQAVASDVIDDVYWATVAALASPTPSGAGIKRARSGTTALEVLVPNEQSAVIALDYAGVYWSDGIPWTLGWGCALWNDPCKGAQVPVRARFADGTFATYDAATPGGGSLAADGDALYVADWCAGTVTRIEHASGAASVIASGLEWPGAILVDEASVFVVLVSRCNVGWSGSTGGGTIVALPKSGGPVHTLHTLGSVPSAIAQDDTTLYYLAGDDGPDASATREAVFAIAKPAR